MNDLQALILGLVQGITEFFPISSSTHLLLVKKIMGISQQDQTFFDLFCHLGTLCASGFFFRKEIVQVFTKLRLFTLFLVALCPLVPAYILLKQFREPLAVYAPLFLFVTGGFLLIAARTHHAEIKPKEEKKLLNPPSKWRDVLCIGAAQGLALLPGVSRCASTVSAARLLGWTWEDAVRFSFLLAIPTILGGTALEVLRFPAEAQIPWHCCLLGFSASFVTGFGAIRLLFWKLSSKMMRLFACYCLGLGTIAYVIT